MPKFFSSFRQCLWLLCIASVVTSTFSIPASAEQDLFPTMKKRMKYLGERQAVLSKNIANANTPKYKAQDLAPFKSAARGHRLSLITTNPMHLSSSNGSGMHFQTVENDTSETTPTGNNVVLDEEMLKASKTNLDYQETTNLYRKWGGMLKTAINGARQ